MDQLIERLRPSVAEDSLTDIQRWRSNLAAEMASMLRGAELFDLASCAKIQDAAARVEQAIDELLAVEGSIHVPNREARYQSGQRPGSY